MYYVLNWTFNGIYDFILLFPNIFKEFYDNDGLILMFTKNKIKKMVKYIKLIIT